MKLNPGLGLTAALLLAGAGSAALAHPHPDGEDGDGKRDRVVVIHDGKGGERHAKGDRIRRVEIIGDGKHRGKGEGVRRFRIVTDGEHHAGGHGPRVRRFDMRGHGALIDCDGGEKVVEEGAEQDGKKTKVIICTKGERPTAATAERIEEALARIRTHDELSPEQKARIESALRSAMERSRSAR